MITAGSRKRPPNPPFAEPLAALLHGLHLRGLTVGIDDALRVATVFQYADGWSHERRVQVLKALIARSDEERLLVDQLAPHLFVKRKVVIKPGEIFQSVIGDKSGADNNDKKDVQEAGTDRVSPEAKQELVTKVKQVPGPTPSRQISMPERDTEPVSSTQQAVLDADAIESSVSEGNRQIDIGESEPDRAAPSLENMAYSEGPRTYRLEISEPTTPLDRSLVHEAAFHLSAPSIPAQASWLEGHRTVEATVVQCGRLNLRYAIRLKHSPVLFLEDISSTMACWPDHGRQFVEALKRQGNDVVHCFMCGTPDALSLDRWMSRPMQLSRVVESLEDSTLMVLSDAKILERAAARRGDWLGVLRKCVWLHPQPPELWELGARWLAGQVRMIPLSDEGLSRLTTPRLANGELPPRWRPSRSCSGADTTARLLAIRVAVGVEAFWWLCSGAVFDSLHALNARLWWKLAEEVVDAPLSGILRVWALPDVSVFSDGTVRLRDDVGRALLKNLEHERPDLLADIVEWGAQFVTRDLERLPFGSLASVSAQAQRGCFRVFNVRLGERGRQDLKMLEKEGYGKWIPEPVQEMLRSSENTRSPGEVTLSSTEEVVAAIWSKALGVEQIGAHSDFFELGGDSILATRVIARLSQAFGVELPLNRLFEAPTVAALAAAVEASRGDPFFESSPIKPRPESMASRAKASFAQERIWFLERLLPNRPTYNVPLALQLTGELDPRVLMAALAAVVRRHEVLRTTFAEESGRPVQVINPEIELSWPVVDLSSLAAEQREDQVAKLARSEARRLFNLEAGPLVRASLLRLTPRRQVLLLTLHHTVSDGWSVGVLVREVMAALAGDIPLPELAVQYADFAVWQRKWLSGAVLDRQFAHWRERLAEAPVLELPTDRPRSQVNDWRSVTISFRLPAALTAEVSALSRGHGATNFMTLLAVLKLLLLRYTGQHDISVGSPVAGRNRVEVEGLIGLFVNTLVLRTDLAGAFSASPTFSELLARVRAAALNAYTNQDLPFAMIVQAVEPDRSLTHSQLFQVMFMLHNVPFEALELPGVKIEGLEPTDQVAEFDLTLAFRETEGGLAGSLIYKRDLFDASSIERLGRHFETLLAQVVKDPGRRLFEFPILPPDERILLLETWNTTTAVYPPVCLHQPFEAQANHTPDAVALVYERGNLTYNELNARSDRLACRLQRLGVGPETTVGICLDRSPDLVVAIFATLKAGGAYVPLHPDYPSARLAFMVADAGAAVVLTRESLRQVLPESVTHVLEVDALTSSLAVGPVASPRLLAAPTNLAYLIYTSGSTGRPKGVAIEHSSAVHLVHWAREVFPVEALAGVLAATSINFDLSVFELFVPLSWGGTVILADNVLALLELPGRDRVTLVNMVPSAIEELAEFASRLPEIRIVNLAGEKVRRDLVEEVYGTNKVERVYCLYGPSEDTTYSTIEEVERGVKAEPTIGRPLPGTRCYLLDGEMGLVPVGAIGELHLAGDGLARGYLGRPALTAVSFVPDPFTELGGRLYRTGDLARYLADGRMTFLRRADTQVKVRGYRIELGEVEAVLCGHPAVHQAVVTTYGKRLVAYVVGDTALEADVLRRYLAERLPNYLIPAAFVVLDLLPLLPNGKVNRRALPPPQRIEATAAHVAPHSLVEKVVADIWCEVLGLDQVGIHDGFFELGGHSLLATKLLARLRTTLHVDVPLRRLFEDDTVAGLAAALIEHEPKEGQTEELARLLLRQAHVG